MNVETDSPAGRLTEAVRSYRRTTTGREWGLDVDMRTLRQMVREAIANQRARRSGLLPDDVPSDEFATLARCIAYAIGGTYHTGYDRPANDAWHKACVDVRAALAVDTAPHSNFGLLDEHIDAVLDALLPVSLGIKDPYGPHGKVTP